MACHPARQGLDGHVVWQGRKGNGSSPDRVGPGLSPDMVGRGMDCHSAGAGQDREWSVIRLRPAERSATGDAGCPSKWNVNGAVGHVDWMGWSWYGLSDEKARFWPGKSFGPGPAWIVGRAVQDRLVNRIGLAWDVARSVQGGLVNRLGLEWYVDWLGVVKVRISPSCGQYRTGLSTGSKRSWLGTACQ